MVKTLLRRISSIRLGPVTVPLFLLILCAAAYAPFITRLGFYWDDFPINWIASTMGGEGLARYFSTNRPVWGLVYQATTAVLGSQPLTWQMFALFMRWITGLALWQLLRAIWPENPQSVGSREAFAAWAAALFVLYPGFSQQFIAFLYSHFFIALTCFLLSLGLMAQAQHVFARSQGQFTGWLLTTAALALGLFNLVAMEYFFLLDLLRPLILWIIFSDQAAPWGIPDRIQRLKRTFIQWLPYLAVFAGAMYWRSVLFGFQTYQPALMSRIKAQPVQAVLNLIPTVLGDVWQTSAGAWAKAFTLPNPVEIGARNLPRYELLVAAAALIGLVFLALYRPKRIPTLTTTQPAPAARGWAWQPVALGLVALFIAGGPFWLTDLKIGLVFANDRFTLPFMLGASLVAAGLLTLLPLPHWSKAGLLAVALGFAVGLQFANAVDYTRDWSVQRSLLWQMAWRMPALKPGTTLLINELPVTHYTDNSLTAPINWTFDPHNSPLEMKYLLTYPTLRKAELLKNFEKAAPFELNYLAATFHGSTDQMVALYFNPPGCLRVLDPAIDIYNWMVPLYLREGLALSTSGPILTRPAIGQTEARPPEMIYGAEAAHGWCYYFEKADLARQAGDWQTVAALGDQALTVDDYPNDPLERFPFIEGYAHTGSWSRAQQITHEADAVSPTVMRPMLCRLWDRIEQNTSASPDQAAAIRAVREALECSQAMNQTQK